ncbi:MAG: phosphotransacetylase family protein [Anaerolineae bacterium]|nr:phosphotransacetylase family protein [Anaerolineae bacterium]
MKPLYITAAVTFSGKTSLLLGIGLKLTQMGKNVGYFKPVSTQPYLEGGKLVDEDADFVRRILAIRTPADQLSSVIIDDKMLERLIQGKENRDFLEDIKKDYATLSEGRDVLLLEGGASMREGYTVGVSTVSLATSLDLPTLGVVRYRDGLKLMDDVLALATRLEKHLLGVVVNGVPTEAMAQMTDQVAPYLEKRGIRVYGVLPQDQSLMALTVGEVVTLLDAKVLTGEERRDALIENLSVGAMSAEQALPRFRRMLNKAVITGGDRADLQAAALETSTTALILSGNLPPPSSIIQRAKEMGVAVLMTNTSTLEAVEAVEKVFGKTRLAQTEKLTRYRLMLDQHFDFNRLFADMGV